MPNLQALQAVPSFGNQLGMALGSGLGSGISGGLNAMLQQKQQRRQGTALADYLGRPELAAQLGAFPSEIQQEIARSHLNVNVMKQQEKQNNIQMGLETIDKMRQLIPSAGPTNFIQGLFGGETTKNRAELETLGRSLIPLVAAGVPIRNQREFDEYRKIITNPNSRQSELEGALNGLQGLFERALTHSGNEKESSTKSAKERFNPENPEHRSKAERLHKTLKDKEKVRKQLEREFEF